MGDPRTIATGVTTYPGLVAALRTRVEELKVSGATLDEVAGLPKGYVGKLLSANPKRRIGAISLGPLLDALGLAIEVKENPTTMAKYGGRLDKRNESVVRVLTVDRAKPGNGKHNLVSLRFLRKIAADGGTARAQKLGPRRRKQIARQAALVRWEAVKAAAKAKPREARPRA